MENNDDMNIYQEAFRTYLKILHSICIVSTGCIVIFALAEWYIMTGVFVFFAYQGIKRLRWVSQIEKRAEKEGFDVAEFIFKPDESEDA